MQRYILPGMLMIMALMPLNAQEKIEVGKDVEVHALTPGA